jgi:hypothetical protein
MPNSLTYYILAGDTSQKAFKIRIILGFITVVFLNFVYHVPHNSPLHHTGFLTKIVAARRFAAGENMMESGRKNTLLCNEEENSQGAGENVLG